MDVVWFEGSTPLTKFAPKFKVPLGIGFSGTTDFIQRLTDYLLKVEKEIIVHEELVSKVPKNENDPYKHTQQWKQHNLLNDVEGLGGEHLQRFPKDPVIEELFNLIRTNYLEFLAKLKYPRQKIYIHAWANVLRNGEWISKHSHFNNDEAYLAGTYYLTTNETALYLENSLTGEAVNITTEQRKIIFFPSWIPHWSNKVDNDSIRISIAFDLVTEDAAIANPWRPHRLLDDPKTMQGIDSR